MTKVSELDGAELALWVARACGWKLFEMAPGEIWYSLFEQPGGGEGPIGTVETGAVMFDDFNPHEDWAQGGPLIEKHRIWLQPVDAGGTWMGDHQPKAGWLARVAGAAVNERDEQPLVAAMRALVASVYGDEVES